MLYLTFTPQFLPGLLGYFAFCIILALNYFLKKNKARHGFTLLGFFSMLIFPVPTAILNPIRTEVRLSNRAKYCAFARSSGNPILAILMFTCRLEIVLAAAAFLFCMDLRQEQEKKSDTLEMISFLVAVLLDSKANVYFELPNKLRERGLSQDQVAGFVELHAGKKALYILDCWQKFNKILRRNVIELSSQVHNLLQYYAQDRAIDAFLVERDQRQQEARFQELQPQDQPQPLPRQQPQPSPRQQPQPWFFQSPQSANLQDQFKKLSIQERKPQSMKSDSGRQLIHASSAHNLSRQSNLSNFANKVGNYTNSSKGFSLSSGSPANSSGRKDTVSMFRPFEHDKRD